MGGLLATPGVLNRSQRGAEQAVMQTLNAFHLAHKQGFRLQVSLVSCGTVGFKFCIKYSFYASVFRTYQLQDWLNDANLRNLPTGVPPQVISHQAQMALVSVPLEITVKL
jgi:hypothetical protein